MIIKKERGQIAYTLSPDKVFTFYPNQMKLKLRVFFMKLKVNFNYYALITQIPLCHLYFTPKIGVKKRCFFAHFLAKNRPRTTICCGRVLLFALRTTIRHQNYTLNVCSMRKHINWLNFPHLISTF